MEFLTDRINNILEKTNLINEYVFKHEPVPLSLGSLRQRQAKLCLSLSV